MICNFYMRANFPFFVDKTSKIMVLNWNCWFQTALSIFFQDAALPSCPHGSNAHFGQVSMSHQFRKYPLNIFLGFSGNDTVQYASNAAKFPRHFNSILQVVGGVAVPGRLYSTVDGAPAANPTAPSRPTSTIINDIITFLRITHL